MAELKDIIETLDNAADSFDTIANNTQKKIYEEVIALAKDIDTDINGKVKQTIANLKRLTQIKARLAALSKDKDWTAGIASFAQYFGVLQKQQNDYFAQHFPENTLSTTAKKKHEMMKQIAVQNTMDALIGDGLKANVTDKLNDILLRAVTSNAKFADLQEELRAHLLGKDGGTGALARYATTYATTALSQFTGQNNKLLTDDLDIEWFMYTGSTKETTREFCLELTKKLYIHKSEIPTILKGKIDDYQCAIYPKTGLPYGMIEGTTVDNFQCNCGGWNCRHQLVPVHESAVPATIRNKFKNVTKDVQQRNEREFQKLNQKRLEARKEIPATRKTLKISSDKLYTKQIVCTKRDIKNIISHCKNDNELAVAIDIDKYLPTLSNGEYEKLVDKGNTPSKIARGVKYYTKYTFRAEDGNSYLLKCEAIVRKEDNQISEHPYSLKIM